MRPVVYCLPTFSWLLNRPENEDTVRDSVIGSTTTCRLPIGAPREFSKPLAVAQVVKVGEIVLFDPSTLWIRFGVVSAPDMTSIATAATRLLICGARMRLVKSSRDRVRSAELNATSMCFWLDTVICASCSTVSCVASEGPLDTM